MAFLAPTLVTSLSTTNFRGQLDTNFDLIQTAFRQVQNTLPTSTLIPTSSLNYIERLTRLTGVIGVEAFIPNIGTDDERFFINHGGPDSTSACMIEGRYHEVDIAFSKTWEEIGITASGDYTVVFGVESLGAPRLNMHLELEDTDNRQELTIWKMDVNRAVGAFTITNLRLMTNVLFDNDAMDKVWTFEHPLTWNYPGVLPTSVSRFDTGIIVPWNCEVMRGFVTLDTPPSNFTDQATLDIQLSTILGTDATNVLASTATFSNSDTPTTTRTLEAISPEPYQLTAGSYIYPEIVTPEVVLTDFPAEAAGLTVALLVRQIYHDVM